AGAMGSLCLMGTKFQFCKIKGVLEADVNMVKLVQRLRALALLGSTWVVLTVGALGLELSLTCQEVLWSLPIYLLVSTDCYVLGTMLVNLYAATPRIPSRVDLIQKGIRSQEMGGRRVELRLFSDGLSGHAWS
uniref:Dolichol-phosphate mannosyltransferase subunit 3 n=1 Tax=Spermophilus dauricus TaxID=99837 RepID=A0A8C9NW70_SPEDA